MEHQRVLLVEDDEHLRDALRRRLEYHAYEVATAGDGEEALQRVAAARPDVIILDLILPRMSGFRVCGHLKQDPRWRDIPIVMLTAHDQPSYQQLGEALGADAYLCKPCDAELLLKTIRFVLQARAKGAYL